MKEKNYFHVSSVEELATCTAPSGCSEGRLTRLISVIHSVSGLTGIMLLWSQISDINVIIPSYNKETYLHLLWQKQVFACRRITGPCIFLHLKCRTFFFDTFTYLCGFTLTGKGVISFSPVFSLLWVLQQGKYISCAQRHQYDFDYSGNMNLSYSFDFLFGVKRCCSKAPQAPWK